jgi:hypothetical protein
LICQNSTTIQHAEARILQDVAEGCFLLWLRGGGNLDLGARFERDVPSDFDMGVFAVGWTPDTCSDLPTDPRWTPPVEVTGWFSIDVRADGAAILDASFDAMFGPDHTEIPTAQVRIADMNLNDRGGGISCVP